MARVAEADFETITHAEDCRVWAWAVCYTDDIEQVYYGTDIDSFLLFAAEHRGDVFYFHNLAFDGKFICDRLLKLGYKWVPERPWRGCFTSIVSSKGKFYQLEVKFHNGAKVQFRDSLKLFPMPVRSIAKAFGLPEGKGELDYGLIREVGHALTDEERDYIRRDVQIVAAALKQNIEAGLTKMTIGSNAFGYYKSSHVKGWFEHVFPVLSEDVDAFIRHAYRGGYTYVEPRFAGVDIMGGISVDYNSMYPSMLISKPYPVGVPEWFAGHYEPDPEYPLYVQQLTCTFSLKSDGLPMVQVKGSSFYGNHEYVRKTVEPVELCLTSLDIELLFENYDVDVVSWDGGYKFRAMDGADLFGAYVEHWGEVKRTSKGGRRQLAKLMLNNLYGKFATNPDVTQKRPALGDDGIVRWELCEPETRDPVYVAVGAYCTAWARHTLIHAIHENRDRFVYCDTDSMHLAGTEDPKGIRLHDTDFCAWKVEGRFTRAKHLRAKTYIWDLNGELSVTCAGMPSNVKQLCVTHFPFERNFELFDWGLSNTDREGNVIEGCGKLTPVAVSGGVVLEPRKYVLHR